VVQVVGLIPALALLVPFPAPAQSEQFRVFAESVVPEVLHLFSKTFQFSKLDEQEE
jgi:hypothetical protein